MSLLSKTSSRSANAFISTWAAPGTRRRLLSRTTWFRMPAACVLFKLEISLLSDETKQALPQVPWRLIKETRNFYVHNYGSISKTLLWSTLHTSIPDLKASCKHALEEDGT